MTVSLRCGTLALALGATLLGSPSSAAEAPGSRADILVLAPVIAGETQAASSELARQWQGVWVVRGADHPGSVQAWAVQGSSVEVYDPASGQSRQEKFTLQSPCQIVRSTSDGNGGETSATNTFAFAPDGLHVAPAQTPGGLRRGNLYAACMGDHVYVLDTQSGQCQQWNATMTGSPTSVEGCAVDSSPPAFVLRHFQGGPDVRLNVAGNALLSPGLAAQLASPAWTFQAAVRLATGLSKPQ